MEDPSSMTRVMFNTKRGAIRIALACMFVCRVWCTYNASVCMLALRENQRTEKVASRDHVCTLARVSMGSRYD